MQPTDQPQIKTRSTTVSKDGKFCFQSKAGKFKIEVRRKIKYIHILEHLIL